MPVNLTEYLKFVEAVTSKESSDLTTFINRLDRVDGNYEDYGPDGEMQHGPNCNVPLLLTSAIGMAAETGEFCEIPKKIFFQGKNFSQEALYHMKRELGDIFWYWTNACRALDLDPNDVIEENVRKLESRYPGGKFSTLHSENRKQGDI